MKGYQKSLMYKAMMEGFEKDGELRRTTEPIKKFQDIEGNGSFSEGVVNHEFYLNWNTTQKEFTDRFAHSSQVSELVELFGLDFRVSAQFETEFMHPHFGRNYIYKFWLVSIKLEKEEIEQNHERIASGIIDELGEPDEVREYDGWYLTPKSISRMWQKEGFILVHTIHHDKGDQPYECIRIKRQYSKESGYQYSDDTKWS